jgi:hypothetical protein
MYDYPGKVDEDMYLSYIRASFEKETLRLVTATTPYITIFGVNSVKEIRSVSNFGGNTFWTAAT